MSAGAAARALGLGPLRLIGSGGPAIARAAFALGVTADAEGFHALPRHRLRGTAGPPGRPQDGPAATALPQGAGRHAPPPERAAGRGLSPVRRPALFGWTKASHVVPLDGDRAEDCARLHATGFPHPWDALDFERLIGAGACFGHAAVETRDPRRVLGLHPVAPRRRRGRGAHRRGRPRPSRRGGRRRPAHARQHGGAGPPGREVLVPGGRRHQRAGPQALRRPGLRRGRAPTGLLPRAGRAAAPPRR